MKERWRIISAIRSMNTRWRLLTGEFIRFAVIGVAGVLITNGAYDLLHDHLEMGAVLSTTAAAATATIVSYIGNRYWSFRRRERTGLAREIAAFALLNGVGLLIQDATVGAGSIARLQHGKLAEYLMLNLGIVLAMLFRFWSYRRWIWRSRTASSQLPPAGSCAGGGRSGSVQRPDRREGNRRPAPSLTR